MEREIKKAIPFTIAAKTNNRLNLIKDIKVLYMKNCKTFTKETDVIKNGKIHHANRYKN